MELPTPRTQRKVTYAAYRSMTSTEKEIPNAYREPPPLTYRMAMGPGPAASTRMINPLYFVPPSERALFFKGFRLATDLEAIR